MSKNCLIIVLILVVLAACGGSESSGLPTEAELQKRAEALSKAMSDEKWLDVYDFTSLRFRELCASGEFAFGMEVSLAALRSFMGLGAGASLEAFVEGVTVEGDNGRVQTELLYKGEPLDFGDLTPRQDTVRWVFVDRTWWQESEDLEEGCPLPSSR